MFTALGRPRLQVVYGIPNEQRPVCRMLLADIGLRCKVPYCFDFVLVRLAVLSLRTERFG
jgi:hypothetical protein